MSNVQHPTSIHQFVECQAALTPNAIAIVSQAGQLTYRELNCKANQVAHYLRNLGIRPESMVGVCIERTNDLIVALLGILKAGAAYVPLDPAYPKERLSFIIEDTQLQALLTQQSLLASLPQHQAQEICIDRDWESVNLCQTDNPAPNVQPENLAYIIYTSGSTGRPKGVAIEHRNTVAFINWAKEFYTAAQLQGVLASTSICFDLSVFEIFVTLSTGGKIILAKDALELPRLKAGAEVTLLNTVPSAAEALLYTGGIPQSVQIVNLAGEPLQNALAQQLYELDHIEKVFNLYGPSEDTTYSTVALVAKGSKDVPTIGYPISNTEIYLLDSQLKPVPEGAEGEIYISGEGLARGYLNRPDLTAEKFIADPFAPTKDSRLYRTGDLAIRLANGSLKFLGRIDHQVKIRGFRIELGEIESVLNLHPNVRKAIVLAREVKPNDHRLVAYVVCQSKADWKYQTVVARELKNFLKQKVPAFMLPSAFVLLEELPLTLNGKLDRRALPIPQWTPGEEGTYVEPTTPVEIKLAKIWRDLLGIEQIGVNDDFYELGGYSLLAVRLVALISETFQQEIPLEILFKKPTIADLAEVISELEKIPHDQKKSRNQVEGFQLDQSIVPESEIQGAIPEIFLTGATGFLGAFLLRELLQQTRSDIYCLVRASSMAEGQARIQSSLRRYALWDDQFSSRVKLVLGDLGKPYLGIEESRFARLAEKIDVIYHCGAWVNIVYPYSILEATNVLGTQEVIRLAGRTKIKPIHFVSTVDVFSSSEDNTVRTINSSTQPGPMSGLWSGYAQSKYTAEQLILAAQERGIPCSTYRPSNIMGSKKNGICPLNAFIPMMIKGCLQIGSAPELDAELNIIPADFASQRIVYLSQAHQPNGQAYQIVNQNTLLWNDLVKTLIDMGYTLDTMSYEAWYRKIVSTDDRENEIFSLAKLFANRSFIQKSLGAFSFECLEAEEVRGGYVQQDLYPTIDEHFLEAHLKYMVQCGSLGFLNSQSSTLKTLHEIYI
ncbi:MAG TPA: amino acid adenylation domain-containing protein [Stenomitos sp.]